MANHKSAIKRARQNEIRRMRNRSTKSRIKSIAKEIREDNPGLNLDAAKSIMDKASKHGVIHKKTASRKISRLARFINAKTA